jgi:integrase
MRRAAPAKPHNRGGIWYLVRRVPAEFAELDRRKIVFTSTEIRVADDPRARRAGPVVAQLAAQLEAYWRGLRDGQSAESRLRYEAAVRRARELNIPYRTADEIAVGPLEEILRRVQLIVDRNAVEDEPEVAAVMGGEKRPALRLSGLVDAVEEAMAASLSKKSPKQLKKWRRPLELAVANFTEALGEDKPLSELKRADALTFRRWWQGRLIAEELDIGTANKNMQRLASMIHTVDTLLELNLPPLFYKLRIKGQEQKSRAAFTAEHTQNVILRTGALDGLNSEARGIVYLVAYHGLRTSEAANLLPERIALEHKVPHLQIRADGRQLKTPWSERDMPLVPATIELMKQFPDGFPRYRDKEDSLSALVNNYFELHGMLPSDDHSLYSLRHGFEDRLTAVEAPEKVIAALMGHKWIRPKYGAGPSLEQKLRWLEKIAFTPPAHF